MKKVLTANRKGIMDKIDKIDLDHVISVVLNAKRNIFCNSFSPMKKGVE